MKSYTFSNITVRPFPTIADLNNPWIFGGVQAIINVSGHDYLEDVRNVLSDKGIESYWFPLVEEGPDMGIDNIIKAIQVLQQCDEEKKKVILHCTCGNNRSRTVAELFYYIKTGEQFEDEYKGYANHLLFNIGEEHLPIIDEIVSRLKYVEYFAMNNGTINNFIDKQLRSIIKDIPRLFKKNELAYISLQQKNERQIRDKVAFRLQQQLDKEYGFGQYMVRCEWPSYFDEQELDYSQSNNFGKEISGRTAVDMAILKMNELGNGYDEVIALVEFKAHCFLNYEKWPYEEFAEDVAKMYSFTNLNTKIQNADLYFIMLTSSIGSDGANSDKFCSAIAYQDIFALNQKKGNSQKKPTLYDKKNPGHFIAQLKDFWKGFTLLTFDFGDKNQQDTTKYSIQYNDPNVIRNTPEPVVKLSGKSFGYHIWQTGLVWGPYKASDLKISAK